MCILLLNINNLVGKCVGVQTHTSVSLIISWHNSFKL